MIYRFFLYKLLPLVFLALAFNSNIMAQLCTGAISDPTVTIDFGSVNPRNTPLPQVPAPYQFVNSDCPAEGFYTVRNMTFLCFNNSWLALPFDHTANDFGGNFLLINSALTPSDIYTDTLRGLCSGRVFELSVWTANVSSPYSCNGTGGAKPNLTFSVYNLAGALLGSYNGGDLNASQPYSWVNYKFQFNLPAGNNDIILKIRNNTSGGCGNDFALDDITLSPCGGNMLAAFSGLPASVINVCPADQLNYLLTSAYGGFNNPQLQWQVSNDGTSFFDIPGANSASYLRTPTASGTYYYRFSIAENGSAACKFNSNDVRIVVNISPFAQATNYVFGCYGSPVSFFASGGSFYQWTGPNGFTSSLQGPSFPSVNFNHAGLYIVKVTSNAGCFSYDTTNLVIYQAPVATVPSNEYSICEGQTVQLNAGGSFRYRWTPSTGLSNDTIANPVARPAQTTLYTVKIFNDVITCYDTATVKINVWMKPSANAGPDKFTYNRKPVLLLGSAAGTGISYSWSPPADLNNPLAITPKATPMQTTTYTLTVISNYGCGTVKDDVKVEVIDKLFIPTGFTPNNDGLNDRWQIITFDTYPNATVDVFNRWGEKVYSSTGSNYQPWDGMLKGEPILPGTYVYVIRLSKNAAVLKGVVNVIR